MLKSLFKGGDITGSIVIHGNNSGDVSITIGNGPCLAELSLEWCSPQQSMTLSPTAWDIATLLSWRTQLVKTLIGRDRDRQSLMDWACDTQRKKAVRFLTGPGGAGKSRLAAEFATTLRNKHHWSTGFLNSAPPFGMPMKKAGTLLVVDYPEQRLDFVRDLLGKLRSLDDPKCPIRVLFLSRQPQDWWRSIIHATGTQGLCDAQSSPLPVLDAKDTCQLVQDATLRLAELGYGQNAPPDPAQITAWHNRNPTLHGLPLFAIAAALHAVFDPADTFSLSGGEIITALVHRERDRLDETARMAGWAQPKAATRLQGLAGLRGGLDATTLRTLAEKAKDIGTPPPDRIIDALEPLGVWQDNHLPELQPDLLAAELLQQILGERPQSAGPWLAALLDRAENVDLSRLDRLAHDIATLHPHAPNRLIEGMQASLDQSPKIAFHWLGILEAERISHRLRSVGILIAKALLQQDGLNSVQQAGLWNNLANCLSAAGDRQGALQPARYAAEIYQTLAEENPAVYLPDLASSLNNLAIRLSETGNRQGALPPARRAVEIYQVLAEENPVAHRPALAMSLNTLAIRLGEIGDRQGALPPARRAVEIYQVLAKENPAAYLPDLAMSLNNLAIRLSKIGDRQGALQPARRAVKIYQALAEENPAAYLSDLAMSFNNLANRLSETGNRQGALQPARYAVEIREALADENPAAYLPDLATSLNNLANHLSGIGDRQGALQPARRAVQIREALAEENPAVHLSDLANSLNNLAICLSEIGDRQGAFQPARHAVEIYQTLAEENPAAHLSDLAMSLNNFAIHLSETGDQQGALPPARRAVEIYQVLAAENPIVYQRYLAGSLNNLAIRLSEIGDRQGVLPPARRAVEIYQALAEENPAAYLSDLAMSFNNLANRLSETGNRQEAHQSARRAVEIYQALAAENPAAYQRYLEISLQSLKKLED